MIPLSRQTLQLTEKYSILIYKFMVILQNLNTIKNLWENHKEENCAYHYNGPQSA